MANRSATARRNAVARGSGKPATNILAALSAAHWAMHPDMLRTMIAVAARQNAPIEAIEAERGKWLENTYEVTVRDGVATIPVHGPMFRYADFFSYMSGGARYESIAQDFLTALHDDEIRAILFDVDSPGGEVHGCQGLAKLIADARDVKPIASFGAGDVCSAAYWLATAAGRHVAAPTSIVGCLGVYTCITDFSQWEAEQGIETIELRSSQTPNKNRDPATAEGRDDIQVVLDALCDVFLGDVADYRGVPLETVLADFGQGGVFVGRAAKDAGLADEIGSYEDVHTELRDRAAGSSATVVYGTGRAPTSTSASERTMTTRAQASVAGAPATPKPKAETADAGTQPDPAANDTTVDPAAPAEDEQKKKDNMDEGQPEAGEPEKTAKAATDAATAERARIVGIQALRRNASEDEVIAACVNDPTCTIEGAALRLRRAESAQGTAHLDALRADETNAPAPKAVAAGAVEAQNTVDALSNKIANAGKPADQRAQR